MSGTLIEHSDHWVGYLCLATFLVCLVIASLEEITRLRKSKPMILSAGLIWGLIGWISSHQGTSAAAEAAVRHNLLQYAELMLILLVVMTYINAMGERRMFEALRSWVAANGLSFRRLFWISGIGAFCLSPLLDNLGTSVLMGAILLACSGSNTRFLTVGFVNVLVAVNAGGVFSPFGDLTTLIVWQQDIQTMQGPVGVGQLLLLAPPALVAYLVPALLLQRGVPAGGPRGTLPPVKTHRGAGVILALFIATIATAVFFQTLLHLPGAIGMATGLSYLQFFGYYLKKTHRAEEIGVGDEERLGGPVPLERKSPFDVFQRIARVEWDALFFLYGVALSVGGLAYLGYLRLGSSLMYEQWGPLAANVGVGFASSVIETIPAIFAVTAMGPEMSLGHWLLLNLAVGTGGSLLSIGSAAGVALMSQARGAYTFLSHLRWTPAILLGYVAGIATHLWLNASLV